jgi:hypothetical protein
MATFGIKDGVEFIRGLIQSRLADPVLEFGKTAIF